MKGKLATFFEKAKAPKEYQVYSAKPRGSKSFTDVAVPVESASLFEQAWDKDDRDPKALAESFGGFVVE